MTKYDDLMTPIYNTILRQAERTKWHLTREAHQRRLKHTRNQRDRRPQFGENRQLQRGRHSWHGDRG